MVYRVAFIYKSVEETVLYSLKILLDRLNPLLKKSCCVCTLAGYLAKHSWQSPNIVLTVLSKHVTQSGATHTYTYVQYRAVYGVQARYFNVTKYNLKQTLKSKCRWLHEIYKSKFPDSSRFFRISIQSPGYRYIAIPELHF